LVDVFRPLKGLNLAKPTHSAQEVAEWRPQLYRNPHQNDASPVWPRLLHLPPSAASITAQRGGQILPSSHP